MLRINNLKLNLDDAIDYASELANLRKLVISKYKIEQKNILLLKINKKAIDARRKDKINLVYSVDLELAKNEDSLHNKFKDVLIIEEKTYNTGDDGFIGLYLDKIENYQILVQYNGLVSSFTTNPYQTCYTEVKLS